MESDIRAVLGKYGYQAVKECLDNEMLQTYQYLNLYFNNKSKENSKPISTTQENVVLNPVVQDVLLTAEIPHSIHVQKEDSGVTEKTVSLGNTQPTSAKQRKTKQMALTKVAEPTPEPTSQPQGKVEGETETKPKKKYFYKKKQ